MKPAPTALLAALALTLGACAGSPPLRAPADYPKLTVKADEPNTLIFTKPGLDLSRFSTVFVAPVATEIRSETSSSEVSDAEAQRIALYAEKTLKEQLARKKMTLVAEPGPDVLSVRFRIIGLSPTSSAQVAMMVPPFALINMLSPKGVFMGSITVGGELYEGLATEPSVAFVATRSRPGVDAASAFGRWAAAEKVLDNAAERLATDLSAR